MPSTIPANTACESPAGQGSLPATCDEIIRNRIPNLMRLYLNPYVAQACYCLSKYVQKHWPGGESEHQVFLANSGEEALSGAVKLARYDANAIGRAQGGLVLDPTGRWEHFAFTELTEGQRVEYLPAVEVVGELEAAVEKIADPAGKIGFVVVTHEALNDSASPLVNHLRELLVGRRPLLIVCTNSEKLRGGTSSSGLMPDIVVFDESVTNGEVPYGGFVASRQLYAHWNRRGMATFHSTTYQPNTISSMHFMRCLEKSDPDFFAEHQQTLSRIEADKDFRFELFRDLYSSSLIKLIKAVNFKQDDLHVDGHYVVNAGKRIFDGVAGVACSVRGHNPEEYVRDLAGTGSLEACRDEVTERLHDLTGLPHAVPAVSGASAVEQALKLGLVSQSPRNYVLALQGGFGGKTLFALTGTWKSNYKVGLDPLYPHVVYVDPFTEDAQQQIDAAFEKHPIGVVQCELVQGVGGVRAVPGQVLEHIKRMREQHDCLLLVDEVQTGVYRTGPFVRSTELNIEPDLLTIGKAVSDMMFPFAMTLYNEKVAGRLAERGCRMIERFQEQNGYQYGYRTMLQMLRRADETGLEQRVRQAGKLLSDTLSERLQLCPHVREVRIFGLLTGIELNTKFFLLPSLKKIIPRLYLLAMIRRKHFPLMMGFCQYEPNVFKMTPPLSTTDEEIEEICETIGKVIGMSPIRLVARLTREAFRS